MEVYSILEVQRTKIEQGNQFQHPPSFHSIDSSYFQALSPLELNSNPSQHLLLPKRAIFIGATSGDLINLRGVLTFLLLFHIEDNV